MTRELRELQSIQHDWYLRLFKSGRDFADAIERKYALKQHYKAKYPDDVVKYRSFLSGDVRYRDASDDWRDAMTEIQAASAMIQALQLRIVELRSSEPSV